MLSLFLPLSMRSSHYIFKYRTSPHLFIKWISRDLLIGRFPPRTRLPFPRDAKYPHRNSSSRESRGSRLISSCPLHLTYISYSCPSELRLHFITPTLSLFLMKHSLRDCRDALAFPFFIAAWSRLSPRREHKVHKCCSRLTSPRFINKRIFSIISIFLRKAIDSLTFFHIFLSSYTIHISHFSSFLRASSKSSLNPAVGVHMEITRYDFSELISS